ncbi:MAG: ATP-binding cassette domain-containing protein [Bdellovibrionota bacterium]
MSQRHLLAAMGRVVSLRGIAKDYQGTKVFDGLDLDIQSGNFYALLGKSGSGKSTLMRILAHRERASAGCGLVLGVGLDQDFCEAANRVAYISEAEAFYPHLTIAELLQINEADFRNWDGIVAQRLAKAFQLDLGKHAGELSRSQQAQLRLLLGLSYSPDLILLDEIISLLDDKARGFLLEFLGERVKAGATILLATNFAVEVQQAATCLILLGDKRVKLNASGKAITAGFKKVMRSCGAGSGCVEVGHSPAGEPYYLISTQDVKSGGVSDAVLGVEPITLAELFLYLSHL